VQQQLEYNNYSSNNKKDQGQNPQPHIDGQQNIMLVAKDLLVSINKK
jgi:hypothetical protein